MGGLVRLFRNASGRVLYRVWWVALVGMLILPVGPVFHGGTSGRQTSAGFLETFSSDNEASIAVAQFGARILKVRTEREEAVPTDSIWPWVAFLAWGVGASVMGPSTGALLLG